MAWLICFTGASSSQGRPRWRASLVQGHSAFDVTDEEVCASKCTLPTWRTSKLGLGISCKRLLGPQPLSLCLLEQKVQLSTLLSSWGLPVVLLPHLKSQEVSEQWRNFWSKKTCSAVDSLSLTLTLKLKKLQWLTKKHQKQLSTSSGNRCVTNLYLKQASNFGAHCSASGALSDASCVVEQKDTNDKWATHCCAGAGKSLISLQAHRMEVITQRKGECRFAGINCTAQMHPATRALSYHVCLYRTAVLDDYVQTWVFDNLHSGIWSGELNPDSSEVSLRDWSWEWCKLCLDWFLFWLDFSLQNVVWAASHAASTHASSACSISTFGGAVTDICLHCFLFMEYFFLFFTYQDR